MKLLVLLILCAVAVYLVVRMLQGNGPFKKDEVRRQVAPDDDLDFLRELDRRHQHPEDPEAS